MRKLTFEERLLLAAQKDPSIGYDSYPTQDGFTRRFRELGIPETDNTVISVESLVVDNLEKLINRSNKDEH